VIGSNGGLTGYGGGLDRKKTLLALEKTALEKAASPEMESKAESTLFV
jgi:hypothetical protein